MGRSGQSRCGAENGAASRHTSGDVRPFARRARSARRYAPWSVKSAVESLEDNKVKVSVEVDETELTKRWTRRFVASLAKSAFPGFVQARRRAASSKLASAPRQPARRRCARRSPSSTLQAVPDNLVDVIAPPEIDITAGREDGPVVVRRGGRGATQGQRRRLRRPARRDPAARAERRRDRCADRTDAQPVRRARARRTPAAVDTDQVTVDIVGSATAKRFRASTRPTTCTRSAARRSCPSSTITFAARCRRHLAVQRPPSRSRRRAHRLSRAGQAGATARALS